MNGSGHTINVAGTSPESAHTVTVPHTHQSFVERCYQCDLIQRNAELRAENNAWQEAMLDLTERYRQSQVEAERLRAKLDAQDQVVEASRRLMTPGAKFGSHYRAIAQALGVLDGTWPKP